MDATKIKRALAEVHLAERSSTNKDGVPRARAVADAIATHRLDDDEAAVLLRVCHVEPQEVSDRIARLRAVFGAVS